jgi:hypothetical protein
MCTYSRHVLPYLPSSIKRNMELFLPSPTLRYTYHQHVLYSPALHLPSLMSRSPFPASIKTDCTSVNACCHQLCCTYIEPYTLRAMLCTRALYTCCRTSRILWRSIPRHEPARYLSVTHCQVILSPLKSAVLGNAVEDLGNHLLSMKLSHFTQLHTALTLSATSLRLVSRPRAVEVHSQPVATAGW